MTSTRFERWTEKVEINNGQGEEEMDPALQNHPESTTDQAAEDEGWGTCAELLLVSAVKRHGVRNWKLIALELKARALFLNLPASCFSEEDCRYRYSILKGQFATSNGAEILSDADVDGSVLLEEVRKLRISHLKQELQQYDSSIGQIQSRIKKMKEEGALLKPCSNVKSAETDNGDVLLKTSKTTDSKSALSPKNADHVDDTVEQCCKSESQPELAACLPGRSPVSLAYQRRPSSSGGKDSVSVEKEGPSTSTSKADVDFPKNGLEPRIAQRGMKLEAEDKTDSTSPPRNCNPPLCPGGLGESAVEDSSKIEVGKLDADVESMDVPDKNAGSTLTMKPTSSRPHPLSYGRVGKSRSKLHENGRSLGQESRSSSASGSKSQRPRDNGLSQTDENITKVYAKVLSDEKAEKDSGNHLSSGRPDGEGESTVRMDGHDVGNKVVDFRDLSDVRNSVSSVKYLKSKGGKKDCKDSLLKVAGSREERNPGSKENTSATKHDDDEKKDESSIINSNVVKTCINNKKLWRSNKVASPREASEEKRFPSSQVIADEEKESSNWTRKDQNDHKKQVRSSGASVEANEDINTRTIGSKRQLESADVAEKKKLPNGKILKSAGGSKVLRPQKSCVPGEVVDTVAVSSNFTDRAVDISPFSFSNRSLDTSPAPSLSVGNPPKATAKGPDVHMVSDKKVGATFMVEEVSTVKGSSSLQLPGGGPGEQKPGSRVDSKHKVRRSESLNAVPSGTGQLKRKASVMAASDGVGDERQPKRQVEQQKWKNVDTNFDGVKERRLDLRSEKSRAVADDAPDFVCTKESVDVQSESKDSLDKVGKSQDVADFDNNPTEKSDVGSSIDSVEDMSPSSRKNRREPKVPGKLLPLLECLRVICAHKSASLFKQRQEYQENREYTLVVKRYLDLGMIRSRLEGGAYSGSVEFFRDILLVFTNALVYSSKDSQEYVGAKSLRNLALVEMGKILQTEALLKLHGPVTRKREGIPIEIKQADLLDLFAKGCGGIEVMEIKWGTAS